MGEQNVLLVHYNFFPLSEAGVRRESVVATEQNQGRMLLKGVSRQLFHLFFLITKLQFGS